MERIIAAAYKVKPEFVCHKNVVFQDKEHKIPDDIYQCRIGRHHAEILHIFGKEVDHCTDGFYTSYGRWVDRRDAAKIALECGQCKEPLIMGNRLDSSDVFDFDKEDKPWKPTEAQIEALACAERWYSDNMGCNTELYSLLIDLKKLI